MPSSGSQIRRDDYRTQGQKPNAIPHFRARKLKSGKVHYYFDHGGHPRRAEPLGTDYGIAIKRWAEIKGENNSPQVKRMITFRYVADLYREMIIPTKATRTQRDNHTELCKLIEFFDDPPGPLDAI